MFEVAEGAQGSITSSHTFDPAHQDSVESLAVHGDIFYSGSRDYYIKKWDFASKQLLQVIHKLLTVHALGIHCLLCHSQLFPQISIFICKYKLKELVKKTELTNLMSCSNRWLLFPLAVSQCPDRLD